MVGFSPRLRAGVTSRQATVAAGEVVPLPLVGLPEDRIPPEATPAGAPAAGPGVRGVVWLDFTRGGGGTVGEIDATERGLPGLTVEVLRGGEVIATTRPTPAAGSRCRV